MMNPSDLRILYEDNHLLVIDKPAGLATMGTPAGKPSLLEVARAYLKQRYNKPGNVYLGVVSRLDAPVTGVLVFARTSKAARRLTEQFRGQEVEKRYLALVEGKIAPAEDTCDDWIGEDDRHRRMWIVGPTVPGAKQARLHYRRLEYRDGRSLIEVELETGRKHQIRLQMAQRGHPIVGDRKYGSRLHLAEGIALHCRSLQINHPTKGERLLLEAPLPVAWQEFGDCRM